MSPSPWLIIAGAALVTATLKSAGPLALGGREVPAPMRRVIALTAPAILAALIVTNALADGTRISVGADTAGVAASALVMLRTRSVPAAVLVAAAVTAALRAL